MNIEEIKRQTNPFHPYNITILAVALVVTAWCWNSTEMSVGAMLDGWGNMITYIGGNPEIKDSGFFPPNTA
ncbi:MAG: phosphonate ABC transporter, permease protein PhnE, partial [Proteobacteria bacterium]|nr:phosphonate ABC transporter, permease protein PhnE [Pseudomonadota bacterium]